MRTPTAAFDPLSWMGIGYAPDLGHQRRPRAYSTLRGNADHAALYIEDVRRHYAKYLERREEVYAMETWWAEEPFCQGELGPTP